MKKDTKAFKDALDAGCIITACSCTCGGRFAWMTPVPGSIGSYTMYGCICHNNPPKKTKIKEIVCTFKYGGCNYDIDGKCIYNGYCRHRQPIYVKENK